MGPREHEWSDYHAYTLPGIVYTYFLLFLTILFTFQLKTHIGGFTLSDPLAKPCGHRCRPFPPPVSATDAPRVTVSCVVQVVTINQRLITHLIVKTGTYVLYLMGVNFFVWSCVSAVSCVLTEGASDSLFRRPLTVGPSYK